MVPISVEATLDKLLAASEGSAALSDTLAVRAVLHVASHHTRHGFARSACGVSGVSGPPVQSLDTAGTGCVTLDAFLTACARAGLTLKPEELEVGVLCGTRLLAVWEETWDAAVASLPCAVAARQWQAAPPLQCRA